MLILVVDMKDLNKQQATPFQVNLRRLLFFHHESAREAAAVIGITEQAISGWLKGTRKPSFATVMKIAEIYEIDPRSLDAQPVWDFAPILGDPERVDRAEENIARLRGGKKSSKPKSQKGTVTKLTSRRKS